MPRQITNEVLATKIDYLTDLVGKHIDRDDERFDKLFSSLNGNGQAGIITRIDRLEQVESTRKWTIRALVMTVLGGAASYFFNFK